MTSKKKTLIVSVLYLLLISSYISLKILIKRYLEIEACTKNVLGYIYLYAIVMPILFVVLKNKNKIKRSYMPCSKLLFTSCEQIVLSIVALDIGLLIEGIFSTPLYDLKLNTYNYITLLFIAPICEELFFRKKFIDMCYDFGSGKYGFVLICNGLIFAIPHIFSQGFPQFCYTLVLGIVWGYVYIKYKNVIYSIVLHFSSNFFMIMLKVLKSYQFDRCLQAIILLVALIGLFTNNGDKLTSIRKR